MESRGGGCLLRHSCAFGGVSTQKGCWTFTNALGQITKYETGNGVVSQREYDDRHFLSAQLATKGNVKIQDFAYRYDIFGNLAARIENKYTTPLEERFTYDYLNRLDSIILNNGTSNVMTYDAYGRIRSKMRDGQIVFDNAEYQFYDGNGSLKPHAISAANADGSAFGPFLYEGVTYNLFDKVDTINLANRKRFCFDYGYDHQRTRMTTINNGILELQKTYVDNTEFVTGGGNYTMTYLCGPMGVFAVVRTTNNAVDCQYVYKDHLGSWTTLTDDQGVIEQEQSFDAWGNCRNPQTWTDYPSNQDVFIRGFCGHEHLWITSYGRNDVGLINMNGRIYDPIMSSFLSVDNYVQQPDNSQNFNRYAYCLNNPLKYVDPEGEDFISAAVIIGGILYGAYYGGALANGGNYKIVDWNWKSYETYAGIIGGGVAGGLSCWGGMAIAEAGFSFCNTVSLSASSLSFSAGMYMTGQWAGFNYDITMSLGACSISFSPENNKWNFGYLFKKGNSPMDNIGYAIGALTNIKDIYHFATWDALTKQQRFNKVQRWAESKYAEKNLTYDPRNKDIGCYDAQNDKIMLSDHALCENFGWAKSTYLHERNHRIKMLPKIDYLNKLSYYCQVESSEEACNMLSKLYNVFDSHAYEYELQNALRNNLSLDQFQMLFEQYVYYSNKVGIPVNQYNYTPWHELVHFLLR